MQVKFVPSIRRIAVILLLALDMAGLSMPVRAQDNLAQDYNGYRLVTYERLVASEAAKGHVDHGLNWYLAGIGTAAGYVVAYHDISRPSFFCPPDDLPLHFTGLRALIAEELEKNGETWRRTPDVPIERVIMQAWARRYPCR